MEQAGHQAKAHHAAFSLFIPPMQRTTHLPQSSQLPGKSRHGTATLQLSPCSAHV
jgi:hypothetical protein